MLTDMSLPWWAWAAMGVGLVAFVVMIGMTIKRHRGMHRSLFASPYTLWMIIFTVLPVILISYYAFTDAEGNFTLDNFKNFWDSHYEANKVIREEEAFRSGDFTFLTESGEVSEDGTTLTVPVSALVTADGQDCSFLTQRGETKFLTIATEQLHVQEDYSAFRNAATLSEDGTVWTIVTADLADLDGQDLSWLAEYGELSESEELLTIATEQLHVQEDYSAFRNAAALSEDGTAWTIAAADLADLDGQDLSWLAEYGELSENEELLTIADTVLQEIETFRSGDYAFLTESGEVSEDGATLIIPVSALITEDEQDFSFLTQRGEVSGGEEFLTIADTVLLEVETFRSGDYTFLTESGEVSEDGTTLTVPVSALVTEDGQDLSFLTQRGEVSDSFLIIDVARLHEKVDYSNYIKRGTVNWDTLVYSLWMAFKCTIICLLLGYPAALFMADRKMKLGSTLVVLFIIPMWMNFLLRTVAWMSLLEDSGLINTLLRAMGFDGIQLMYTSNTVLLGMVYNYLPFMVFPIYTVLSKMDYRLSEAAADLGCNSMQTLYKVTVPLSVPGIVSGITMVFMPSVTTFFIPRVLGGGYTMMFGDLIESKFLTEGNWNAGSALSLLMMLLILVSLSILRKVDPNGEGGGLA